MSSNYSKKQLKDLRNQFEKYLRENNPQWSDITVSTHVSDAFFALNNNVGVDFWASLVSEESMLNAGDRIEKFLKNTNRSGDPKTRAKGYFRDLRFLKTFLDLEHPTLATDWSKKISEDQFSSTGEPEETHTWIFQAVPEKYNAIGAVEDLDKLTWSVNQYTKQIKKSHKAYIWLSGTDGGIIASGTILCNPEMRDPDLNDPYNIDPEKKTEQHLVVDIEIEHKLTDKIISRNVLKNDERTKKLSILIYHQGTNFPVKKEEEYVIESIIDGTYERIPTLDEPKSTNKENKTQMIDVCKNTILYGPPGTGKTYSSIQYAVAIIEEKQIEEVKAEGYEAVFKRYLKYKDDGLIAFTTFHQSFSYEEFIEGIRPVVLSEDKSESTSEIEYEVHDGIFKAFCDKAGTPVRNGTSSDLGLGKNPTVWKVSLEGTGENFTRSECMEKGHIRIGWDDYGKILSETTDYSLYNGKFVLNAFYNKMQIGDIVMSCYSKNTIDAIGVITGEPEWHDEYEDYKRVRKVNWLLKGINEDIVDLNAGKNMIPSTVYKLSISVSDALQIVKKHSPDLFGQGFKIPNRVFIIDEINRGNISKIFGELITLIEPSKRINASEELRATLPYSGQNFGVPDNVYILG
ncbi:MAG: EVE domain-containing protein, partial [Synergistaceae bacterium]|nr:EVE domain-containing protein [Synergistaceae bacterium]